MPDNPFPPFHFMPTGIGSVPFLDVRGACIDILALFPEMPFWPQFVQKSPLEDMSIQYSEGLPLLEIQKEQRTIVLSQDLAREEELTRFYEHVLAEDLDFFSISREYAEGLYGLLEALERQPSGPDGAFIKGQTVGPITFLSGIRGLDGKAILYDTELCEAMTLGLALKARWQAGELARSGRRPVIFVDEPSLSGFGSAFSPIERHQVIDILQKMFSQIKESNEVLIGIHCCGNTDWSMIVEAGPDILNFDAFSFMEPFLLYGEAIGRHIEKGGLIAWGMVPTSAASEKVRVTSLLSSLKHGLETLEEMGLGKGLLAERSLLTPACGMGSLSQEDAKSAMKLLADLSLGCRKGIEHLTAELEPVGPVA